MTDRETTDTVSTEEMAELAVAAEVQLVDVRSPDAYNGWPLRGEPRGGHIPGARSLPSKWTEYIDWLDIVRSKGINPRSPVILYGYGAEAVEQVGDLFRQAGFDDVRAYPQFVDKWVPEPGRPLERLERWEQLLPPERVHSLVSGRDPSPPFGDDYVVCHCHYRNESDYKEGHVPGAIPLDTLALESPETWNRRAPKRLRRSLEAHGISRDTTVILYGRHSSPDPDDPFPGASAGQLAAMRCAFLMIYAGVDDVRVLNGGMQSWTDAGLETATEETRPDPVGDFGAEVPTRPDLVVDTPGAEQLLDADDGLLVSIRSRPEFEGKISGYRYIDAKGRIPGAVFADSGRDAYHMDNYRNPDHTTLEHPQIARTWQQAGITPDRRVAFYCGTGWRASEAFFNAWLMGWPRIAVYDGGWYEWSGDPDNPTEAGPPS